MKNKILSLILSIVLIICAVAPMGATAAVTTDVPLPSLTADTNCTSYNSFDDSIVYYYTGVNQDNYSSYVTTLKNNGYDEIKTYNSDSCYYALMDNGVYTVFVSFLRSTSSFYARGRLRVFIQKSGTPYHTQSTATSANVCDPMLWQLDVDNTGGDNGGMSYVIRLSDGTFMVIDGGYETYAEADNLYSVLVQNNKLEGKPVISAWFITHMHNDHYGVLYSFTNLYSNDVTVKGFYYNFPGQNIGDIYVSNISKLEAKMKQWEGAKLYSKIHSGMVMGFAGATVEVLATHEDVSQSYYEQSGFSYNLTENSFESANDTSTVIRLNIKNQNIIFLADAQDGIGNALMNTHTKSYLSSDVMQMAHHGFGDGVSYKVIETIDPEVILWPQDIVCYENGEIKAGNDGDTKTFVHYYTNSEGKSYIKSAKECASEIIPAYRNEALSLPYTAKTLYKNGVPDYNTLKEQKVQLHNQVKGIYVQSSIDGSSLRIIGVLDMTENDLLAYESFGFNISMIYNGVTYNNSFTTKTVYTSLIANGKPVPASNYGGTYFYAIEITDLDFAEDSIEFILNGTGTTVSGNKFTYETAVHLITTQLDIKDNGTIPSIDFSDIISGAWTKLGAN